MTFLVGLTKLDISNDHLTVYLFFLVLPVLVIYVYRTYIKYSNRFLELASKIPGPKTYPLIGSAYVFGTNSKEIFQSIADLSRIYDTVCGHWLGPIFYVSLQKPGDIAVILSSNTMVNKTIANDLMKSGIGDGLIASSGSHWKTHRRFLNPTFANSVLERYTDIICSKMRRFADVLEPHLGKQEIEISPFVQNSVYEILCETMLSTKANLQNSEGKQNQFIESLIICVNLMHTRMFKPWLYVDFLYYRTQGGKLFKKNMEYLQGFVKDGINRRRAEMEIENSLKNNEEKTDRKKGTFFLDYMLEFSAESNFSDKDIMDESCNNMFAGFDSVAYGILFFIYVLSRRFDIQEKIVEEINEVLGSLEDKPFTLKDLENMKYLNRVTKESLRLFSPVPYLARQISEETKLPSGYTIPSGTAAIVLIFMLHRDPELYPNPNVFDPDHFLPEWATKRPAYTFVPFSGGARNCIAHKYAVIEMKSAAVSLLRKYWLTPVDMKLQMANKMNLFTTNGIKVGLKKRTVERPEIKDYDYLSKNIFTSIDSYNVEFKESYL